MKNVLLFSLIFISQFYLKADEFLLEEYNITREDIFLSQIDLKPQNHIKIVFVGGIFNNVYLAFAKRMGKLSEMIGENQLNPFAAQMRYLEEIGQDYELLETNTQQSCRHNASFIASFLKKEERPILFVTHSKGGADLLESLVFHPELQNKVKGIISLQSPFHGSPWVDFLESNIITRTFSHWVVRIFGGTKEGLSCLSREYRRQFNREYAGEIASVIEKIPMVNMGSWFTPSYFAKSFKEMKTFYGGMKLSLLEMMNWFLSKLSGSQNDGMVPVDSMCLAQESCLVLENIDHAGPIMDVYPFKSMGESERVLFSQTLFEMMFKRISE